MNDDEYIEAVKFFKRESSHVRRINSVSRKHSNFGDTYGDALKSSYFNDLIKPIGAADSIEKVLEILKDNGPGYLKYLRNVVNKSGDKIKRDQGQSGIVASFFEDLLFIIFFQSIRILRKQYGDFVRIGLDSKLKFPLYSGGIKTIYAAGINNAAVRFKTTDFSIYTVHPCPTKERGLFGTEHLLEIPAISCEAKSSYIDATMISGLGGDFKRISDRIKELELKCKIGILTETLSGMKNVDATGYKKEYSVDKMIVLKNGSARGEVNDAPWNMNKVVDLVDDFGGFLNHEISERFREQDFIRELLKDYARDTG